MNDPHQHLKDYKKMLDDLDGRVIRVTVLQTRDKAATDRAVREALDRLHRRAVIAGG
jgi:hypothetical protein